VLCRYGWLEWIKYVNKVELKSLKKIIRVGLVLVSALHRERRQIVEA
jgi:hypothetical protein